MKESGECSFFGTHYWEHKRVCISKRVTSRSIPLLKKGDRQAVGQRQETLFSPSFSISEPIGQPPHPPIFGWEHTVFARGSEIPAGLPIRGVGALSCGSQECRPVSGEITCRLDLGIEGAVSEQFPEEGSPAAYLIEPKEGSEIPAATAP
jgi:hypothetical protein